MTKWYKDGALYSGAVRDKAMMERMGYTSEPPETVDPPSPVKRYSTLKIIRALGDEWSIYRTRLEESGILDQFFACNYLAADDPVFAAFVKNVPDEAKNRLNECLWEV